MKTKGRRESQNVEDRRNWPADTRTMQEQDPYYGDLTFNPPMTDPAIEPKVLPYRDPEAEFNRARMQARFATDFGDEVDPSIMAIIKLLSGR